jgi:hypothetical protein
VMSRVLVVVVLAAGALFVGCSSGERSCGELRAELQQVTGITGIRVDEWSDLEQLSEVATRELELRDEIDRRCG